MANAEQLILLKKNLLLWKKWREKRPDIKINLDKAFLGAADLRDADLSDANLREAYLVGARLLRADLTRADLGKANLSGASLQSVDFSRAELTGVKFNGADLSGANLSGVNLGNVDLSGADLRGVNFSGARVGGTLFVDVDLSQVNGLETIEHYAPSSIGIDTVYKSKGNISEIFMRGCGVPENFITFMHSLTGKAFDFYSCFISHSAKDKQFCERLYADLQAKGVRTWYFPEDARWGEPVWGEIDRSIRIYDKLVVVLSENSLNSRPVLREIQRSLDREDKEHKNILFPIRIDDYIFNAWEHERKVDVLERVVGDFGGWDKDAIKYQKAFEKLLRGLQNS